MSINDAFRKLADAIIVRAVDDWRRLCEHGAPDKALAELRAFFNGEWCSFLCGTLDPAIILEGLEKERRLKLKEDYINVKLG